ncbi:MAG: hypothetical protein ACI87W_001119 [Halieaceae bacterium]|jgi:hypothetical protein
MKRTLLTLTALLMPITASAQGSLSSTMDVYVFPTEGQETAQQQADEAGCYEWAVANSGGDPFELSQQASADQQQAQADMQATQSAGSGSGLRGAARGAAAGAIIGEIANDDAGEGAAWGAAAGAVRGRRQGRKAQAQAQQQVAASAENTAEATAGQLENFKKAFSVCLEAKNYMVKY